MQDRHFFPALKSEHWGNSSLPTRTGGNIKTSNSSLNVHILSHFILRQIWKTNKQNNQPNKEKWPFLLGNYRERICQHETRDVWMEKCFHAVYSKPFCSQRELLFLAFLCLHRIRHTHTHPVFLPLTHTCTHTNITGIPLWSRVCSQSRCRLGKKRVRACVFVCACVCYFTSTVCDTGRHHLDNQNIVCMYIHSSPL